MPARGHSGLGSFEWQPEAAGEESDGEFDPGSGRTLAACLKHASRGRVARGLAPGFNSTGERVSNTWVTCPEDGDNLGKPGLIPDTLTGGHPLVRKGPQGPLQDGPAAYQLVGEVTAHQGDDA